MIKKREAGRLVEKPDWVDVLLAAWATIVSTIFAFWFVPTAIASPGDAIPAFFAFLLGYCIFGFVPATIVCAIVGLPALALAEWLKLTEWWQAAIVGAAAGLLVAATPLSVPGAIDAGGIQLSMMFVIAGALAGLAAWRERRRGKQAS